MKIDTDEIKNSNIATAIEYLACADLAASQGDYEIMINCIQQTQRRIINAITQSEEKN